MNADTDANTVADEVANSNANFGLFCEFKLHAGRCKVQFTPFEFSLFLGEVSNANGHKGKAPRAKQAKNQQSERTHSKVPFAVGTVLLFPGGSRIIAVISWRTLDGIDKVHIKQVNSACVARDTPPMMQSFT